MVDTKDDRSQVFQFLIQHPSKKYTTAEIATQLGMTSISMLSGPSERLRNELDLLATYGLIELTIEDRDSKYSINSHSYPN